MYPFDIKKYMAFVTDCMVIQNLFEEENVNLVEITLLDKASKIVVILIFLLLFQLTRDFLLVMF